MTLEKHRLAGKELFRYEGDLYLSFGASLDPVFESSESDYGSRFSVARVTGDEITVLYQSRGSFDSYFLRPTFFRTGAGSDPLLILAETGAEYSWGARVFLVWPDGRARDIGFLDVAVIDDPGLDTVSVIPHTRVRSTGKGYEFTFTRDVIYDPGGLDDHPVEKNRIRYLSDGASLRLVEGEK